MSDVTRLLDAATAGDRLAAAELFPLMYDELRKLAAARLADEQPGQTLQPTALVHEAYLRLVGNGKPDRWDGRGHFFAAAAEAMRRILVETARRKGRLKRGGDRQRVDLDAVPSPDVAAPDELLAVDDALSALAAEDPVAAELIKLRYFAGLSVEEAGDVLGMARSTAYEQWAFGRAWIRCHIGDGPAGPAD